MLSSKPSKVAVIGAGVTGLAIANMLQETGCMVEVFEMDSRPGGLVKCKTVQGNLYHLTGGHVFNSRRLDVLDWFWKRFDRENDFFSARRNAVASLDDDQCIGYPVENHLYQFNAQTRKRIIGELLDIVRCGVVSSPKTLGAFFASRFGSTLNQLYFTPYNNKIWGCDVSELPIEWLEGKLPMPTVEEIIENNIAQIDELQMVHSTFFYAKNGGSQFLADTLASQLIVHYESAIHCLLRCGDAWLIDGALFDAVVYTGNIKSLAGMLPPGMISSHLCKAVDKLASHGTTSVLCEIDSTPYSWIYLPSPQHGSHRIICTGNFSPNNNAEGISTATIEFSRKMTRSEIDTELRKIPFHPRYISHHWEECTYPMQDAASRSTVAAVKGELANSHLYLLGRFAEWEYYNMDAAIGACIDFIKKEGWE